MRSVGKRVGRLEDAALLAGKGRFVDDIHLPGTLEVAFVRSPHAHARILGIDAADARGVPGVHAILTLADLDPVLCHRRMALSAKADSLHARFAPHALADKVVRFVGEPIALVVAESRYVAEDAAAMVAVDYDILPAAVDCRDATASDAPRAHSGEASNVVAEYGIGYGDVDAAFASAAHVMAATLRQHRGLGHPIEARGILAEYRAAGDGLVLHASTQKPHDMFQRLGHILGLDEDRLRVVTPDVGGGFGPKLIVYQEDVAIAASALLLKRTIKWIEDRREHFTGAIQERDQHWTVEIAVDEAGRILGVRGEMLHDMGAYALQEVNLPYNSATSVPGPYVVPNYAMKVRIALTNKVPVSSVRGAGYPQPVFAMERLMDLAAAKLGMDRAEIRRRNLITAGMMPYTLPIPARSGETITYDSGDYPACMEEVLSVAGWADFPKRQAEALASGRHIGIGLANAVKGTGRGPFESGTVRVRPSGRVYVTTGAVAMGQGLATALAQICADELGISPEDVTVVAGDTMQASLGLGGFASRQLVTAGSSVLLAAREVAAKAKKLAAQMLECDEAEIELAENCARLRDQPARNANVPLGDLARKLAGAPGYAFPAGLTPGLEATVHFRSDKLAYANACHVAEVEVDIGTGGVTITRYVALHDAGRLINPLIVEGQIEGGIVHGIGNALFEWMGYDETGQPVTTTFAEYLLPTATELPKFETLYRESPSPLNPLGAKGVGEIGTTPVAAAVISAIEDALKPFGIRIAQTPIRPHEIVALIADGASP